MIYKAIEGMTARRIFSALGLDGGGFVEYRELPGRRSVELSTETSVHTLVDFYAGRTELLARQLRMNSVNTTILHPGGKVETAFFKYDAAGTCTEFRRRTIAPENTAQMHDQITASAKRIFAIVNKALTAEDFVRSEPHRKMLERAPENFEAYPQSIGIAGICVIEALARRGLIQIFSEERPSPAGQFTMRFWRRAPQKVAAL